MSKIQIPIDFDNLEPSHWPTNDKFPLNWQYNGENRTVDHEVENDIAESDDYLVITGFTSLSNLIDKFGSKSYPHLKKVRIVLGWEPNRHGRKRYPLVNLEKEIRDYWLKEEGLSIVFGGAVIKLIEDIKSDKVEFRYKDKLHAKLYIGNEHAILGSANFSKNGLTKQEEANIRVTSEDENDTEAAQYLAIKTIAEKFYSMAKPYNEQAIELLRNLIQPVSWEEALARAIAEVIEGAWLADYEQLFGELNKAKLWPTQWKGIAQAMDIIQTRSNVLIADPTGAGKTKFCSALILTLVHWLWENGKQDKTNSLVVCPPIVIDNWQDEFRRLSRIDYSQISMQLFSHASKKNMDRAKDDMQLANIIALDEAHNYLNPDSKRSQAVQNRKADHTLLITATPMNKKAEDLLRLIELLDVDNLTDEDFSLFKNLKERPKRRLENQDLKNLKSFISQFLVRRTKAQLNKEIEKNPELYLNKHGEPCQFPYQDCPTYNTKETTEDIEIATQITDLAKKLKGLIYLRNLRKPDYELRNEDEERSYIKNRLRAATSLSGYMIRSSLRSSHVALVEHIEGTEAAKDIFRFDTTKNKTGNQLEKIEKFKSELPKKGFKKSLLPNWFSDQALYEQICVEELSIYSRISALAKRLSGKRELGKVKTLMELQKRHNLIVAFDSTVISLDYLNALFQKEKSKSTVYVVTGNNQTTRDKVIELFKLGSIANNCIALCSDQMAEGVNLQQASAIVLLDMPSVLRVAEQRIGRIDRMDSPHDRIEAYWPNDSEQFGLKGDQRLVDTTIMAENIYGSNITLPEVLREKHFSNVETIQDSIEEYKAFVENDAEWDGVHNSFQPIINLKEGNNPLIPESTYEAIKTSKVTIKSRVGASFIESSSSWCFFSLRGSKTKSPRWYLIDEEGELHTEFPDICDQLRQKLSGKPKGLEWKQDTLEKFITKMRGMERQFLPPKKKRALLVAESILDKKHKVEKDPELKSLLKKNQGLFKLRTRGMIVDFEQFANQWIDILQPYLDAKRANTKRKRVVYNLYSLTRGHKAIDLSKDLLQSVLDNCLYTDEIDMKIASCIIGVKED
tara:strand:+ start:590 stop:3820 length:3231 start_codon:yes stop_codon:yes gene_type:complete